MYVDIIKHVEDSNEESFIIIIRLFLGVEEGAVLETLNQEIIPR